MCYAIVSGSRFYQLFQIGQAIVNEHPLQGELIALPELNMHSLGRGLGKTSQRNNTQGRDRLS